MKRTHSFLLSMSLMVLALMFSLATPALADGWLDPTFDQDGIVRTDFAGYADEAREVILQPDAKIVAAGIGGSAAHFPPQGFAVARYLLDGALDTSFSQDGLALAYPTGNGDQAYAAVLQPDGCVTLGGQANAERGDFGLVRFKADGSLDETFGGDGMVTTNLGRPVDWILDLALQADSRILAVGGTRSGDDSDVALARYNPDGSLDTTFSGDGLEVTQVGADSAAGIRVKLLPDGKILALAKRYGAMAVILLRYNADGSLDTTFDGDGIAYPDLGANGADPYDMIVLPGGKILIAATFGMGEAFGVARVNPDGTVDKSFGDNGRAVAPKEFNGASAVAVQRDGRILLTGRYFAAGKMNFAVARFTANGTLDAGFGQAGVMYATVGNQPVPWAMALDADEKIVLAGSQEFGSVSSDFTLVRFAPPLVVMRSTWLPVVMR